MSHDKRASLRSVLLPELVRPEDLADALDLTPPTVRRWIRKGAFGPYTKIGGRLVLRRESVLAALEEAEEDPRALRLLGVEADMGAAGRGELQP